MTSASSTNIAAPDFHQVFRHSPSSYMILDEELRYVAANECYCSIVGVASEELIGRYVFDAFPEDGERLAKFKSAFERAVAGERNSLVRELYKIAGPDGEPREVWWTCHHEPVFDTDGRLCGVMQNANDVTAEVKAEAMRDIVLQEIDHRMKNQLATISAIARRTARDAETTDAFLENFDRRIQAMARTHQMLVDEEWSGLSLGDLVIAELSPYRDGVDDRIVVEGPPVTLSPAESQSLGLAIHELATNAAKYGGLSDEGVSLSVRWDREPHRVRLSWREEGRRAVCPPARQGFGSIIVDQMLPRQIGATVLRDYHETGLHCDIAIPR